MRNKRNTCFIFYDLRYVKGKQSMIPFLRKFVQFTFIYNDLFFKVLCSTANSHCIILTLN